MTINIETASLIVLPLSTLCFGLSFGVLIGYRASREPARPLHLTVSQPPAVPGVTHITAAEGQSRAEAIREAEERTQEEREADAQRRQDALDRARQEMPGAVRVQRSADPLMQDVLIEPLEME